MMENAAMVSLELRFLTDFLPTTAAAAMIFAHSVPPRSHRPPGQGVES